MNKGLKWLKRMQWLMLLYLAVGYTGLCTAQMLIDTSYAAEYLVQEVLLGKGVVAGNIRYTGANKAIGLFLDSSNILSIQKGLLLTSGGAHLSKGPNKFTDMQFKNKTPGYPKLDVIANGPTHDAAVLEFDFITSAENLSFDFIFASEEYTEYVGSKYNDVFAFFINGPGLANVNLAVLPKSKVPVTVNSINYKRNKKYYVDNPTESINDAIVYDVRKKEVVKNKNYNKPKKLPQYNIQYDGFTAKLQAACKVVPGEIYHIEIAIADVSDFILDSGVYLAAHSFSSRGPTIIPIDNPFQKAPPPADTLKVELLPVPEIPVETKVPVPEEVNVEFIFDTYYLTDSAKAVMEQWITAARQHVGATIEVTGHTDNVGSEGYNNILSQNRALAVSKYLIELGIAQEAVRIEYKGETSPLETNNSASGRAKNRRAEIRLQF